LPNEEGRKNVFLSPSITFFVRGGVPVRFVLSTTKEEEMGSCVKGIILIIILLFFITFGVKNSQPTQLRYYFDIFPMDIPLYGVAYISIVIGIIIGMVVGIIARINLRRKVRRLQRENREIKEKLVEEEKEEEPSISPPIAREEPST